MRKLIVLAVSAILLFASCKKESGPTYYVKFKKNGTWVTWTNVMGELGPDFANPAKTDFGISSGNDAATESFHINIQVDGPNFPTGSYDSDNIQPWVLVDYMVTNPLRAHSIENAPSMPPSRYVINVTSITSTTLSGNFTGNYLYDNMDDVSVQITEGEFHVLRAR